MDLEKIDLAALKKEHGEIHYIEVEAEDGTFGGIFKKPTIKILAAVSKTAETDPLRASIVMFNSTKVLVDPEIEESEEMKLAAAEAASKLFRRFETTAKKL